MLYLYYELPDKWAWRRFLRVSHSQNRQKHEQVAIFLRKMATCSCFAGPIDIRIHASMYFMSICPLAHIIQDVQPVRKGRSGWKRMNLSMRIMISRCWIRQRRNWKRGTKREDCRWNAFLIRTDCFIEDCSEAKSHSQMRTTFWMDILLRSVRFKV